MNKESFLSELRQKLSALSQEERDAAMTYYEEYFNDAGVENEQSVLNELGSVEKVANGILSENNYPVINNNTKEEKSEEKIESSSNRIDYGTIVLMIIVLIITLPIVIPILASVFGILIGFTCAGIGISISGIVVVISGIATVVSSTFDGLLLLGVGCILFSVGLVLTTLMINVCSKGIPAIVRVIVKLCKMPFQRGGISI